jgi:hypothetical protein
VLHKFVTNNRNKYKYIKIGFEVLTAMTVMINIILDVSPYNQVRYHPNFRRNVQSLVFLVSTQKLSLSESEATSDKF